MSSSEILLNNPMCIYLKYNREEEVTGCNGKSNGTIFQIMLRFPNSKFLAGEIIWADKPIFSKGCFYGTLYDAKGNKGEAFNLDGYDIVSATHQLLEKKLRKSK